MRALKKAMNLMNTIEAKQNRTHGNDESARITAG